MFRMSGGWCDPGAALAVRLKRNESAVTVTARGCEVFSVAYQRSSDVISTDLNGPMPGKKSSSTVGLILPVLMLRREPAANSIYPRATSALLISSCALSRWNLNAAEGLTWTPTESTANRLPAAIAAPAPIANSAAAVILNMQGIVPD